MAECIERDAVMKRIMAAKWMGGYDGAMAMEVAASAPAADVGPVGRGGWVHNALAGPWARLDEWIGSGYHDEKRRHLGDYSYCPNCGAKMDGGGE